MKVRKTTSLLLVLMLVFSGCYYDIEEELYPTLECQTMNISYADDILPIISTNCYGCHNTAANFGNVTLEGYDVFINYIDDQTIIGVIKHKPGFSPMPKNEAKLLDCEIEKIEAWIQNGALDN